MKRLSFARLACYVSMLTSLQLVVPLPLLAQAVGNVPAAPTPPVHTHPYTHTGTGWTHSYASVIPTFASTSHAPNLNLDLSSTLHSITAGQLHNFTPTSILVNSQQQSVTSATLLTPAQVVALEQVLQTTHQFLTLGANGNAVGGTMMLTSRLSQHLASLVIPQGVTVIDRAASLNLSGDLSNSGSLYAISTNPQLTNVTIDAGSIYNTAGALLTTALPSAGLPGPSSALPGSSLTLNAFNNIVNAGTISSAGNLSLNAGGSITNAPGSAGFEAGSFAAQPTLGQPALTSQTPLITAVNTVSLTSNAGSFANGGLIAAQQGNVNFSTGQAVANMLINNTGGTFQALRGDISLREASFKADANIRLTGGNYLSRNLNLYSGTGTITGSVGELSGNLNTVAKTVHLITATTDLKLGDNSINGDPLFVNTSGSIEITGVVDVTSEGQPLTIVAQGDIFTQAGDTNAQLVNHGGPITLIAGANINAGSYSGTITTNSISGSPPASGAADGTLTINDISSASSTGGSINLSFSTQSTIIDTSSSTAAGGAVKLVALSNGQAGGTITLPTSSTILTTAGQTVGGSGGSVLMLAGANPTSTTNTISVGNIITAGTSTSGSVKIYTQAPASNNLSVASTGAITGTITNSGTSASFAGITVGNITTAGDGASGLGGNGGNGGAVTIEAGGNIQTGYIRTFGGGGAGGLSTGGNGGNAGQVFISSSNGSITVGGDINASGGGGGGGSNGCFSAAGFGGNAGSITIIAGGAVNIAGPVLAAGGGDGGINFTSGNGCGVTYGGGGGGSFGGGGGGGGSLADGSGGGGGFFGGGGGGGGGTGGHLDDILGNVSNGGGGGGGGYQGAGGGGGGGGGGENTNVIVSGGACSGFVLYALGGGGGGGGGGGVGSGGGGGSAGQSNNASTPGVGGGGGGGSGIAGGTGQAGQSASSGSSGAAGAGGSAIGGGGNASGGGAGFSGGGVGGTGGQGTTTAGCAGTGGTSSSGAGGLFGQGGLTASSGTGTNGQDVGIASRAGGFSVEGASNVFGHGGAITIIGQSVTLSGTIGATSGSWPGFSTSPYAGDAVNALGTGGSINISSLGPAVYFANANYGQGAPATSLSAGSITSSGSLNAGSVLVNGVSSSTSVAAGTYSGVAITEGSSTVNVSGGSLVTPAEWIAVIQVLTTGTQSLTLAQTSVTTTSGTGYATTGSNSNFTVAASNIPTGNFTSLILPSGATANVSVPDLVYTGGATVQSGANLNFTNSNAQLNAGGPIVVDGTVTFKGSGSGAISSGTSINVNNVINFNGVSGAISSGTSVGVSGTVNFNGSGSGVISSGTSVNVTGTISFNGSAGSITSGTGGVTGGIAGTGMVQSSGPLSLATVTGFDIGAMLSPLLISASTVTVSSNGTGSVYLSDAKSASISTGSGATGSVGVLTFTDTAVSGILTVGGPGINAQGAVTLQFASGTNGSIVLASNVSSQTSVSLQADGTGMVASLLQAAPTTLTVGTTPFGQAVNPAGTLAYIANNGSNTVSVVSLATNTVVATIPVGNRPFLVTFNQTGTMAYILNSAGTIQAPSSDSLSVIDTSTNRVVATVTVPVLPVFTFGATALGFAVSPDGKTAYVTETGLNGSGSNLLAAVAVINIPTNTMTTSISLGGTIAGSIAINPVGTFAYVAVANGVSVINTSANQVTDSIALNFAPTAIVFNPSGAVAYAAGDPGVSVINTSSNTVTTTVTIASKDGFTPSGLTLNSNSTLLYAMNSGASMSVIATSTNSLLGTGALALSGGVLGAGDSITPFRISQAYGNSAYVGNLLGSNVYLLNPYYVAAPLVTLTSHSGDITTAVSGSPMLTASTSGNISITSFGSLTIGNNFNGQANPGSSIAIQTTGAGAGIAGTPSATLFAQSVNLMTMDGNIGTPGAAVNLGTAILSANAGDPNGVGRNVYLTNNQPMTLNTAYGAPAFGATGTFSLTNAGTITIAHDVNSSTASGTGIILATTGSSSDIVEGQTGGTLYAQSVNLSTTDGNIGSSTSAIQLATESLGARAGDPGALGRSVYLNNNQPVTINTALGASGTFSLTNLGTITIDLDINSSSAPGQTIMLADTGSASPILEGNNGGTLFGQTVNLSTTDGDIGSTSTAVSLGAGTLTVSAGTLSSQARSVYLANNQPLTLGTVSAAGGFSLTNAGTLTIGHDINSSSAPGSTIMLQTTGSGADIVEGPGAGILYAQSVNLMTSNGTIGSSSGAVNAAAASLSAIAGGAPAAMTSVFIANNQPLTISAASGASGTFSLINAGTITIGHDINSSAAPGNTITLSATGSGSTIVEAGVAGTLFASTVSLTTAGGDIGTSSASVKTNTPAISAATNGTGNVYVTDSQSASVSNGTGAAQAVGSLTFNDTAVGGTLSIAAAGYVAGGSISLTASGAGGSIQIAGNITAGGGLSVTSVSGLSIGNNLNLIANSGVVSVRVSGTTGGPMLQVGSGSAIVASNGVLTLENDDVASADNAKIVLGSGSTLLSPQGNIFLTMGAAPAPQFTLGTTPTTATTRGQVFFGANGITASTAPVSIFGIGQTVVLNGSQQTSINLGPNVLIRAGGTNIPSLDLRDAPTVTSLVQLQQQGTLGGTLTLTGGLAVGGNIIFDASDNLTNLSAENIPAGVTVTFKGLQAITPVNVNLTSLSTNRQAIISGTEQFIGLTSTQPSNGVISISSTAGVSPVLSVSSSGKLTSDGTLTVTAGGNVSLAGTTGGNFSLSTTTASNGSIAIGGITAGTGSTMSLIAGGTGSITQTSGLISAQSLSLITAGGTIGMSSFSPIVTNAATLVIATTPTSGTGASGGNVFLTDSNTTAVSTVVNTSGSSGISSGGNGGSIFIKVAGNVMDGDPTPAINSSGGNGTTLGGTAGSITFTSTSAGLSIGHFAIAANGGTGATAGTSGPVLFTAGGPITLTDNIAASAGSLTIQSTGSGNITQTATKSISTSNLVLSSAGGSIGTSGIPIATDASTLTISTSGSGSVFLNDTNTSALGFAGASKAGGQFNLTSTAPISLGVSSTNATITASTSININGTGAATLTQPVTGTTLLSPTIVLSAAGGIGSNSVPVKISNTTPSSTVNLTAASSGGNVLLATAGPVNLTGSSFAGSNTSSGNAFSMSAPGAITIASGATVTGFGASGGITLQSTGSITQSAAGTTLLSEGVTLTAGISSTSTIGSSSVAIGLGLPSGVSSSGVALTATAGGSVSVASSTGLALGYGASSAGTTFSATASGSMEIFSGVQVSAGTSITLTATGAGSSITQNDLSNPNNGNPPVFVATLFSPTINLTSGTGTAASIGDSTHYITMAAALTGSGVQTVNLTTKSGGDTYLAATNPVAHVQVNANLVGASSAAGTVGYQLVMPKAPTVTNGGAINLASLATITAGTTGASITLNAGKGSSITQSAAGTSLISPNVNLGADQGGSVGNVGGTTALGLSSGTTSAVLLSAIAGLNVNVSAAGSLTLLNASSANNGSFTATAATGINVGTAGTSGTIQAKTALTLIASGAAGILETDSAHPSTLTVGSGNTITLTATAGPIGTLGGGATPILVSSTSGSMNLVLSATTLANVSAANAMSVTSATAGGALQLATTGSSANLTSTGTIQGSSVTLLTSGATSNVALGGNLTATGAGGVTISASGVVSEALGKIITSTSGPVSIIGSDLQFGTCSTCTPAYTAGTINTGTGQVTLDALPVTEPIFVGGTTTQTNSFNVTPSVLGAITAGTLVVGSNANTGGITVSGGVNVSGSGAGAYNLQFLSGNNFTANSQTITMGTKTLTVNASGTVDPGTVTGGATTVTIISGANMNLSGNVTVTGTGTVTLNNSTPAGCCDINAPNATITVGGGALTKVLAGDGLLTSGTATNLLNVNGTTVQLSAAGDNVGSSTNPVRTNATNLTANDTNSGSSVFVSDSNSVNLTGASSTTGTGGTFQLSTAGNLVFASGATVTSATSQLTSSGATSTITQAAAGTVLIGSNVTLTAGSGTTANIGSSTISIGMNSGINGTPVTVSSTAGGSAYISGNTVGSASGSLTLGASSVATSLLVNSTGLITTSGAVSSPSVTLQSNAASNGGITLGSAVGQTSGTTKLMVLSSGDITQSTGGNVLGSSITLQTGSGNVGAIGVSTAIVTADTGTLTASTSSTGTGVVSISNTGSGMQINSIVAGGAVSIQNSGTMLVNGVTTKAAANTSNGNITLVSLTGQLKVIAGSSISSSGGDITLENQDTSVHGSVLVDTGATLHASSTATGVGNVNFVIGTTITPQNPITSAPNVTINLSGGGQVFGGKVGTLLRGFTAFSPTNTLNATGRNVVFSNGGSLLNQITLNGSDVITADPPTGAAITVTPQIHSLLTTGAGSPSTGSITTGGSSTVFSVPTPPASIVNGTNINAAQSWELPQSWKRRLPAGTSEDENTSRQDASAPRSSDGFDPENIVLFDGSGVDGSAIEGRGEAVPRPYGDSTVPSSTLAEYQPISYVTPTAQPTLAMVTSDAVLNSSLFARPQFAQDALSRFRANGIDAAVEAGGKTISLNRGSVLFAPESDLTVQTSFGQITVGSGAVVLVVALNNGVAIYDLHDAHKDDVVATAAGQKFLLAPGHHLQLTHKAINSFEQINPLGNITHRKMQMSDLGVGARTFSSEFSLTSALNSLKFVSQMTRSNNPREAQVARQIMKNAAIIMQTHRSAEPYRRFASNTSYVTADR